MGSQRLAEHAHHAGPSERGLIGQTQGGARGEAARSARAGEVGSPCAGAESSARLREQLDQLQRAVEAHGARMGTQEAQMQTQVMNSRRKAAECERDMAGAKRPWNQISNQQQQQQGGGNKGKGSGGAKGFFRRSRRNRGRGGKGGKME